MSKLVAIVLLTSLCLNITGYHFIFYFRQQEMKAQMKKVIQAHPDTEDETKFVFSLQDKKSIAGLEWEGENEFSLDGQMYDVIEKKVENNQLVIRCLSDKKETFLVGKYSKANKENNSEGRTSLLVKLFSGSYLASTIASLPIHYTSTSCTVTCPGQILISRAFDVLTPPPQSV